MSGLQTLITIIHAIGCSFLVVVVLLQSGKGGGVGAAFGGASSTVFGGRGAGSFLARVTSGFAILFFLTSLTLSYLSSRQDSVVRKAAAPVETPKAADEKAADTTAAAPEAAAPAADAAADPSAAPQPGPAADPSPGLAPAPAEQPKDAKTK